MRLVVLFSVLLLSSVACNQSSHDKPALETLVEKFPEIEDSLNEVPQDIKRNLAVPRMEVIPFEVEFVTVMPETKFKPFNVDVIYNGKAGKRMHVKVVEDDERGNGKIDIPPSKNVALKNGDIEGAYDKVNSVNTLNWITENDEYMYRLMVIVGPDEENTFEKEDIIPVAESILEQQ